MDLISRSSNIVTSPAGIIHVLGYTPTEGNGGAPISVRVHFHPDYAETIYVRLIVGHKAVATTVREIDDAPYGRWQLDAVAPPFDKHQSASSKVLISVQALNEENAILDTATFGEFFYRTPDSSFVEHESNDTADRKKPRLHINTGIQPGAASHLPSPTSPHCPLFQHTPSKLKVQLHRRTKADPLMRPNRNLSSDAHTQTPILELVTDLQDMCIGWSATEVAAGRRLVRFSKVQDGRRLIVSCHPIKPEEYRDSDSVISCIYREESDSFFITSVDIIFLLERLTNSDFPVEEKNRIRRNLEGFRPTTVSKHKAGFEDFFQRIMEFSDPRPRNIEKDLKVFEWSLLHQALDKILSKYTINAFSVLDELETSAELSSASASDDADHPIKPYADLAPLTNIDPIPDNLRFLPPSNGSDSYSSPVDNIIPSLYPQYSAYSHSIQVITPTSGGWYPEYKPVVDEVHFTGDMMPSADVLVDDYPTLNYTYEGLSFSPGLRSMENLYV